MRSLIPAAPTREYYDSCKAKNFSCVGIGRLVGYTKDGTGIYSTDFSTFRVLWDTTPYYSKEGLPLNEAARRAGVMSSKERQVYQFQFLCFAFVYYTGVTTFVITFVLMFFSP